MIRLPQWEAGLIALLEAAERRPFAYGAWDCALFGAAVIEAVTGEDHGADWRGRYKTEIGYMRRLKAAGHDSLFGPFDVLCPRVAVLQCRRGDLVTDGASIGCMWAGHALFVGGGAEDAGRFEVGLVTRPTHAMRWGWKVGLDG